MKEKFFTHRTTQRSPIFAITFFSFACLVILLFVLQPTPVGAGVYYANDSVTYKEYWVNHSEFTGGFVHPVNDCDSAEDSNPWGGSHYLEPWPCHKIVEFTIPDDFSQALKAEIFLDLWRNQEHQIARFKINDGVTHAPNTGANWSRTPWAKEINLNELIQGTNKIDFWDEGGGYHVHDIAIRIYYDDAHPLVPGSGSDVTPATASLVSVAGDGAPVAAGSGGTLTVNNNQLTLTANVSGGARYIEFHGYYFGYDEDNNGLFTDWHSRTRNTWHPGGEDRPTGGTIDHIGSIEAPSAGQYSVTWDISHIPDQTGMKFKVRVVDAAGNVNDASGGVSANFAIERAQPLVAFYNPFFYDAGLWMEGTQPREADRQFFFPPNTESNFVAGKIVHAFWGFPLMSLNGQQDIWPNFPNSDYWHLSTADFNINNIAGGLNTIKYSNYTNVNYPGDFIERPGPMFVLKRTGSVGADTKAPTPYAEQPGWNNNLASPSTPVTVQLFDLISGINPSTVEMTVKDEIVSPGLVGTKYNYSVVYYPPELFVLGEEVPVEISACDYAGNCMTHSYSFIIQSDTVPSIIESDDFNSCTLNTTLWEFVNPLGDAAYNMTGDSIEIELPAGTSHDAWVPVNSAPRLMQAANDTDFSITAKYDSVVDEAMQVQGLIIEEDAQNFLRFNVRYFNGAVRLEAFQIVDGGGIQVEERTLGSTPQYFSAVRTGNEWRFYASDDGLNWGTPIYVQHNIEVNKVGAFVGNSPPMPGDPEALAPAFTGELDYFFNGSEPIDPEDPTALVLPVEIVGQGEVTQNPECGNPVTLTAVADEGWSFDNWDSLSGNIGGSTNPLNTAFTKDEIVTATFSLNEYTLNVDVVNNGAAPQGTVSISPEQDVYLHDEEVTLTANVPAGWEFMGWSGDVSPAEENLNPLTLTMVADRDITATFTSIHEVTLDIVSRGDGGVGGSATITPEQTTYEYGDEITLSATPTSGWAFKQWEGTGLTPAQAELPLVTFEVTADMDITAVFAKYVTLNVTTEGSGSVEVDPDESVYLWGDTVVLTAVPDTNWYFSHWEGDITGYISANPKGITLSGSNNVKAVFTDTPPTRYNYLPVIQSN